MSRELCPAGGELKGYGTFFDELCFLVIGFDRGQPPTPGRQASKHTPRVNSKASELTSRVNSFN